MVLSYGNIPYTDESCKTFFGKGWGEIKGTNGATPFGQLPIMVVDGKVAGQSGSMTRYAATLTGLVPSDPVEALYCDSIYEASQELAGVNPIVNMFRGDVWQAKKQEYFEMMPPKLANLARELGEKDFFCGSSVTYADFGVYHICGNIHLLDAAVLDAHPNIKAFMTRIEALPGVKEYLESRPKCVDIGTSPRFDPLPEIYA